MIILIVHKCIELGKPALCEKTFTANTHQAKALFKLTKEKYVFITEAIRTRFKPFSKTIRQLPDSDIIGIPTMLTARDEKMTVMQSSMICAGDRQGSRVCYFQWIMQRIMHNFKYKR